MLEAAGDAGGMDLFRAMRLLIPPAWQNVEHMDAGPARVLRVQLHALEPWDGPAGIVLTDGRYAACVLDRNGLRPARYVITKDRHITIASEIGVWDYQPPKMWWPRAGWARARCSRSTRNRPAARARRHRQRSEKPPPLQAVAARQRPAACVTWIG
jgi:hypothetical protein